MPITLRQLQDKQPTTISQPSAPQFATLTGTVEEDKDYYFAKVYGGVGVAGVLMFYISASGAKYYLLHSDGEYYGEVDSYGVITDWVGIKFKVTGYVSQKSYQCWKQGTDNPPVIYTLNLNVIRVTKIEKG